MASAPNPIVPDPGDAVRIVPLYDPHALLQPTDDALAVAPAVTPKLTYRNGPLLTSVRVFTLFWGAGWASGDLATTAKALNAFFDFVLKSALIDQLGEYSVKGKKIRHGKRIGTTVVATPAPGGSATDTAIRHMLQQEIASNPGVPQPTPSSLYFVYLPPGTRAVQGGSASCQAFCGYHDNISAQIFYAVMPYAGCKGCLGGMSALDALTVTSSHELCEAITDPVPGQGWYDDANGEIGDICAWKTKKLGSYTVQLEWSNAHKRCG